MPQSLLACLTGFASDETAMEAAFAVAALDKSHIEAVHIRVDATDLLAVTGILHPRAQGATRQMEEAIRHEQEARSAAAQKIYAQVCARHLKTRRTKKPGVTATFQEVTTLGDEMLRQARFHDMAVAARAAELGSNRLEHLLMESGKPVLIAPAKPANTIGKTVLVAWKNTAESARALTAALPLLVNARTVVVFSVCDNKDAAAARRSLEDLAGQLRRHGVEAQMRVEKAPAQHTAEKIRQAAYGLRADLIVMGAYGHSRAREWILGGATRELIGDCDVALLMAH